MIENFFQVRDFFSGPYPQLFFGGLEALCLYVFYLGNGVISLFTPLQFFIEKIQHSKIKRPNVITPGQIDVVVGVEASKRDRSPKISFAAARKRLLGDLIKVALRKSEVNNKNTSTVTTEHKIRSLDITVDKSTVMNLSNASEHFNQNLNHDFEAVALFETPPSFCKVDSQ